MAISVTNFSTETEKLSTILLSTLDEHIFFNELSKFINSLVKADIVVACKVQDDSSALVISKNGETQNDGKKLGAGEGIAGHVIKTKRPYFSNNVSRDPLYAVESSFDSIIAELCVPVSNEGIVIATLHFQMLTEERKFSREDMTNVLSILSAMNAPIVNMKMYLTAKSLNEVLKRKLEEKELELQRKLNGQDNMKSFLVEEKQIVGKALVMKQMIAIADKAALTNINILIEGENGSGKEIVAKRIHCRSKRAAKPYIIVDCFNANEEDLLAELFGKDGINQVKGAIEKADGGTLILKEVASLKPSIQSRLMAFLRDGITYRINGQSAYRSNVRVIATTAKMLADEVAANHFREDLFYKLNTVILKVPALRERSEDIEILANFFLNKDRETSNQKSFAPGAMNAIMSYKWPGNIREMMNMMERAFILSEGKIVEKEHLAEAVIKEEKVEEMNEVVEISYKEMTLNELEKRHIVETLDHVAGNKTKTAKLLGITVKTLYNKLHSYGMIEAKEMI